MWLLCAPDLLHRHPILGQLCRWINTSGLLTSVLCNNRRSLLALQGQGWTLQQD